MKVAAQVSGGALQRRLARLREEIEQAALDAAADALASELARVREAEGLRAPLLRGADARRRMVGAADADSVARELGDPGRAPAPWLAPFLPGAPAPMRAAVQNAVARALSRFER